MKAAFGTLGSAVEAHFLAAHVDVDEASLIDAGWRFIGRGTSRECWLNPSRTVVYKYGTVSANLDEHKAAQAVRDHLRGCSPRASRASKYVYFPKTRYFEGSSILAMEFIDGPELDECSDCHYDALDALTELGLAHDFWYRNGIEMADGRCAIIDLGYEEVNTNNL